MTGSVRAHLEAYFGPIERRVVAQHGDEPLPFEIVKFGRGANDRDFAVTTLGLADVPLHSWVSGEVARQELMVLALRPDVRRLAPVLERVAAHTYLSGHSLLRGQVVGLGGPLVEGASVTAFFASTPAYLPDEFAVVECDDRREVAIGWLVPITSSEAAFVESRGSEAFEEKLAEHDPDVLDLGRLAIDLT